MSYRKETLRTWTVSILVALGAVVAYHWWVVRPMAQRAEAAEHTAKQVADAAQTSQKALEPLNRMADAYVDFLKQGREHLNDISVNAQVNSLTSDLQTVRSQLELFRVQHEEKYPTLAKFAEAMTKTTDIKGEPGTEFGPYLHTVATNPFTNGNTVGNGDTGTTDWYYNETTGEFRANDSKAHAAY